MSVYDLGKRRRGVVRPSPPFLAFVALTVAGGALAWFETGLGSRLGDLGVFLFILAGWVVSVCFHEFAHAYTAYRAGDHSVEGAGYLTLNPFKYAHPLLSIVLPLFFIVQGGIGLPGGAVYLHTHNFRSRQMQSLAAAVGPITNAVLAVVLLLLAKGHLPDAAALFAGGPGDNHARFWSAVAFLGFLQVTAAVLNLLPIPGLDGYAIIEPYLDPQTRQGAERIKPWGMIGVIVLLQFSSVRDAFFNLVGAVYRLTGANEFLWQVGHEFFRFWVKNPL
jgi:Zn-dependent protease